VSWITGSVRVGSARPRTRMALLSAIALGLSLLASRLVYAGCSTGCTDVNDCGASAETGCTLGCIMTFSVDSPLGCCGLHKELRFIQSSWDCNADGNTDCMLKKCYTHDVSGCETFGSPACPPF